jgi:hypothetical protein
MRRMSSGATSRLPCSGEKPAFPWLPVLAATAVAAALRFAAILQEPWIDEVWSWGLARGRASAAEVFTLRSSNSHALNTLWIYFAGDRPDFVLYRLPAFLAGIACVPLAARIAGRYGRAAALAAAWLTALSFLHVVFSSEARGYAPMVFFSLASFDCAWTWLDGGARRWLVLAWLSAILGVLSQTLFVVGWSGIALAVAARIGRDDRPRKIARTAAFASVPLLAFGAWWLVNVRHVFNAGAPPWSALDQLARTASSAFGLPAFGVPDGHVVALVGTMLAAIVLALDVRWLAMRGDPAWVAQLAVVALGSAAIVVLLRHEYVAERYFLVPLAFWLLAFARVLGRLAERAPLAALGLLLLFVAGNARELVPFLRVGRGEIGELVRAMGVRSSSNPIVVTSNFDFNVRLLLDWHARSLGPGRAVRYVPQQKLPPAGADFAVIQQPLGPEVPAAVRIGARRYALVGTSRHAGPSGADWAVYRRESAAEGS